MGSPPLLTDLLLMKLVGASTCSLTRDSEYKQNTKKLRNITALTGRKGGEMLSAPLDVLNLKYVNILCIMARLPLAFPPAENHRKILGS